MHLRSRSRRQNPSVSSRVERGQNLEGRSDSGAESRHMGRDQPTLLAPMMRTAGLEYFCPDKDCNRHSSAGEYGRKRSRDLVNHLQNKCRKQFGHPESRPWKNIISLKRYLRDEHFVLPAVALPSIPGTESTKTPTDWPSSQENAETSNETGVSALLPNTIAAILESSASDHNVTSLTIPPDSPGVSLDCGPPELGNVETTAHDPSSLTGQAQPARILVVTTRSTTAAPEQDSCHSDSVDTDRRYKEILEKSKASKAAKAVKVEEDRVAREEDLVQEEAEARRKRERDDDREFWDMKRRSLELERRMEEEAKEAALLL
ncbi:hypothetical protein E6O75_ATG09639 [Venturia nashicola]|uniref:Uncharacterized protein n=1 Tax=Venturia nashicola TaxID=86259 RepID=A0A4Z1NMD5_9PEZI|nr:hypothetical protein E6O75_ATG09639 [Venturia nashicola]